MENVSNCEPHRCSIFHRPKWASLKFSKMIFISSDAMTLSITAPCAYRRQISSQNMKSASRYSNIFSWWWKVFLIHSLLQCSLAGAHQMHFHFLKYNCGWWRKQFALACLILRVCHEMICLDSVFFRMAYLTRKSKLKLLILMLRLDRNKDANATFVH